MSSISNIVNVQITRQSQTVSEQGFGTLMILDTHKQWNDLIRYYNNMQAVAEDFMPYQLAYQAANAVFSQAITPQQIAIGRRQADSATITVITAMTGQQYIVTINNIAYNVLSTNTNLASTVTFNADFVTGNLIKIVLNTVNVGTITSIINFDIDFVSLNSIIATVNGVALGAVTFNTDQATTIGDLATQIATAAGVTSATVTGVKQITVVFTSAGNNTVNSVITTLGASQPVATISEGSFTFNTNQLTTMQELQTALEAQPNILSVVILPSGANPNRVLALTATVNEPAVVNSCVVDLGVSQPTAAIVNTAQSTTIESIANSLVASINATSTVVTATDNADGTFTLADVVSGTPYTLSVSTDIVNAVQGIVTIEESTANTAYDVTINGTLFEYVTPINIQTAEQISLALVALINAASNLNVTATDNANGTFTLASTNSNSFVCYVTANLMTYQFGMTINPLVATPSVTESLNNIQAVDDGWYALAMTDRISANVQLAAAWVQGQTKIFGTASLDPNIINEAVGTDTTSIAAIFNNLGYTRSFVLYHQDADSDFPECAWFGDCLPLIPGTETWAFKQLTGIAYSDLSNNQALNCRNKQANTYEYIGGVGITQNGTVASGEYIDIIRGIDWLVSTIQTYVYSVLVNSPKVPYTDAGITSIEAQILRALAQGVTNNLLTNDPEPTVTVPKASSVSSADKANRILRNVNFQATLAGAIQNIQIMGTVSV